MSDDAKDLYTEAKQAFGALVPDDVTPVVEGERLPSKYAGGTLVGRMRKWWVIHAGVFLVFVLSQALNFAAYVDPDDLKRPFAAYSDASSVIEQVDIQTSGNLVYDWRTQAALGRPAVIETGVSIFPVASFPITAGWVRPAGTDGSGSGA